MISEVLGIGEENAITSSNIAKALNIDTRDVRQCVRRERLNGEMICSSGKGYFLPADDTEISNTIKRLFKQGRENIRVAETLQKKSNKG